MASDHYWTMKRRSQNCPNQVDDRKSVEDKDKYFNFKLCCC